MFSRPSSPTAALLCAAAFGAAAVAACHSAPPPPLPPPPALHDSAAAALRWVQTRIGAFQSEDSAATADERGRLASLTGNARVIGLSELTEGTHEFPYVVRRTLTALGPGGRVRGLAIQAPMAEAMEVDRYVRTGRGDVARLLRTLGSWRWETREMRALVDAMRAMNSGKAAAEQVGFYGFEIPTAEHAVAVITGLRDSVVGAPLKSWLARQYACVAINEGAHWGLEGRTSDSSYWNACGPATTAGLDSIVALRRRISPTAPAAADVAFAEQMARLVAHHVRVGLRHLKREEVDAEHVLFLADMLGPDAQLLLWGGDVEMGRLTLDRTTVQTGVPLGARLGDRYVAIAYAVGEGTVRTRSASPAGARGGGGQSGLSDIAIRRPLPDTYEDVFYRVTADGYWLDLRSLPSDTAGSWLRGPRNMRLITELYSTTAPELFQTPVEFPKNYDAVVFVRRVTPARQ